MAEYVSREPTADRDADPIFQSDLDKRYICPICISFLKDPVQTSCGHRFCKKCFDVLRGFQTCRIPRGIIKCPMDNTFIIYEKEVFDDNAMKREIQSQGVMCNNAVCGCLWLGELRYLKDHLQTCTYFMDECPYGCGTKLLRSGMNKHKEECGHREVEFEHYHLISKLFSPKTERCNISKHYGEADGHIRPYEHIVTAHFQNQVRIIADIKEQARGIADLFEQIRRIDELEEEVRRIDELEEEVRRIDDLEEEVRKLSESRNRSEESPASLNRSEESLE